MIRTHVTLDECEYKTVKERSRALGISMSEVIRRAIRDTLPYDGSGAWMRFAGLVESGDSHSSRPIDEIVYGAKD